MKRTIKNVLKLLATGTLSLLIAACYGVRMMWQTKKVVALSPQETGIEGLSVTLRMSGQPDSVELTDSQGSVDFISQESFAGATVDIKDVDGPDNGGSFKETSVVLDASPETIVPMEYE